MIGDVNENVKFIDFSSILTMQRHRPHVKIWKYWGCHGTHKSMQIDTHGSKCWRNGYTKRINNIIYANIVSRWIVSLTMNNISPPEFIPMKSLCVSPNLTAVYPKRLHSTPKWKILTQWLTCILISIAFFGIAYILISKIVSGRLARECPEVFSFTTVHNRRAYKKSYSVSQCF